MAGADGRRQPEAGEAEAAQAGADPLLVGPGVEQGAEQHVAGETADRVDVGQPAHCSPSVWRAIRAAIVPAPKPSSMLTTATPAAHEVSIDRSALMPPNAAP